MSATTAGRMPLNAAATHGMSKNCVRHIAISSMTSKEGSTVPNVAIKAPGKPPTFLPTKIEIFTAKTPGQVCATATKSMNSSRFSQRCLSTTSASMIGIMAYPPPMVNMPIRKNVLKRSLYIYLCASIQSRALTNAWCQGVTSSVRRRSSG